VKEHPPLERFVTDLLQRDRWARNVLRQALLGGLVEYADAVVDAESGMLPGQEVSSKGFIKQVALYQKHDDPRPEDLDHGLEPGERDVEEGPLLIKATLQDDGMKMRVPPEHVPERLVRDDHPGEKRSARGLVVKLINDTVDQSGYIGEQAAVVAEKRPERFG